MHNIINDIIIMRDHKSTVKYTHARERNQHW